MKYRQVRNTFVSAMLLAALGVAACALGCQSDKESDTESEWWQTDVGERSGTGGDGEKPARKGGLCSGAEDVALDESDAAKDKCDGCTKDADPVKCSTDCHENVGFSKACAECQGELTGCIAENCPDACTDEGFAADGGELCVSCVFGTCETQFSACHGGISSEDDGKDDGKDDETDDGKDDETDDGKGSGTACAAGVELGAACEGDWEVTLCTHDGKSWWCEDGVWHNEDSKKE